MADLKLLGQSKSQIKKLVDITAKFSKEIKIHFGLENAQKILLKRSNQA